VAGRPGRNCPLKIQLLKAASNIVGEYDRKQQSGTGSHLSFCKNKRDNAKTKGLTEESFPCRQIQQDS
jgi:hypothetical protein